MNSKRKLTATVFGIVALATTAVSTASAAGIVQQPVIYSPQNLPRSEVNDLIADVILAGYREGFQVVADERGRMVDNGRSATFKVYLQAGVQYRFAGRCDSDCTDLDMALEDSFGRELIADRDPDDTRPSTIVPAGLANTPSVSSWQPVPLVGHRLGPS
jgi:hypothetical protein